MSGAGESPRVPPEPTVDEITGRPWPDLQEGDPVQKTAGGMATTAQTVQAAADAAIKGASKRAARLGGDGEPYPEDVAIPVPIRGGLIGKAPYSPTPEQKPQIDAALRRQMSEDWPTIEQQTRCWPPKLEGEKERDVARDVLRATGSAQVTGQPVDWPALAYRLARIPKAREAIFAAMDVEGRPWRWADTAVVAVLFLAAMALGAALLAVAAKVAS